MPVKKLSHHRLPDVHKSCQTDNDVHETAYTMKHSVTSTATTLHGANETNECEKLSKLWVPNSGVNVHRQPLTNGSTQSNEVSG